MKKVIVLIIAVLISIPGYTATLYMGSGETYTNLQAAMAAMSAGDTLIIRDGTYTGTSNQIDANHMPPSSNSSWTTIKAENDGAVYFDGENARNMFDSTPNDLQVANRHWIFEGIIWCRSSGTTVGLNYAQYVKFLRCGAYDAGAGNNTNFSASRGSQYILFEGCYSYGTGRYKFVGYQSDHLIFRNCVARIDGANPQGEVLAGFSMYSVDDTEVQNCIVIDSDQTDYWSNVGVMGGAFCVPSTNQDANRVTFTRCIALNTEVGSFGVNGNNDLDAIDVTATNCVFWDSGVQSGRTENTVLLRGIDTVIDHCTFGSSVTGTSLYTYGFNSYDYTTGKGSCTLTNNIIYALTGGQGLFYDVESEDYNALYDNYNNYAYNTSQGAHTQLTTNPIYNASTNPTGALKYITRIESGSTLSGDGSTGDIGANVDYLIGTAGTLHGETGYATSTGTSMWPFPNEALIKTKLAAYSNGGLSGARGFCTGTSLDGSAQTLTKYIWEYLGNQIPADIYGSSPSTPTITGGFQLQGGTVQ